MSQKKKIVTALYHMTISIGKEQFHIIESEKPYEFYEISLRG